VGAITDLAPGPLHVVGHSMGGAAALLAEHRRPGTFTSAYLYEPIVPPGRMPGGAMGNPMADAARRRREVFPSRRHALERYASRPPLSVLRADSLAAYVEHGFEDLEDDVAGLAHSADASPGGVRLRCRGEHEARTFESTGAIHLELVRDVALPTTVAVGAMDPGMVADMGPALATALPHARLERHPNLGHFGPLQDPSGIAAAIVAHTSTPG
jgi:pimeloyl-ACP methyl ester carboxylesterase